MDLIKNIISQAKNLNKKIIFPEGEDERILQAVHQALKKKMIKPILVGNKNNIQKNAQKLKISLKGIQILDPKKDLNKKYVSLLTKIRNIPQKTAELIAQQPLFFAALAVANDDAQGMIGGCVYTSGEFIAVSKEIIGLQKGVSVPSSFFLMSLPNYRGGEKGNLIYADASVNPNPSAEELADIAVVSGYSAKSIFQWRPKVALLSFSTKGSADHPDVCKVQKATRLAQKKDKNIQIDGELQADAALVSSVAKKKIKSNLGPVAGKANVLVFPDLDAANISYKLTQRLANAKAYGPILQGFKKPVSDLSRGATAEDIYGIIALLCIWSKRWKK